jgi:hypothetical protein
VRSRLSYSNVVATIALFLAVGGGAVYAAGKIGSRELKNGAVKTKKLANGAVKTQKLADDAATGAKVNEASLGLVPHAALSDSVGGVSVQPLSMALPSQINAPVVPLFAGGGMSASFACEQGLPQLVYFGTPSAQGVLTAAIYTNGANPLLHTPSSGVDVLPTNTNGADIALTLREGSAAITQARFTFLFRANGFGSANDCFLQGTIERF